MNRGLDAAAVGLSSESLDQFPDPLSLGATDGFLEFWISGALVSNGLLADASTSSGNSQAATVLDRSQDDLPRLGSAKLGFGSSPGPSPASLLWSFRHTFTLRLRSGIFAAAVAVTRDVARWPLFDLHHAVGFRQEKGGFLGVQSPQS